MVPFYRAISGKFVITGKEPDGDSVRFIPDQPELLDKLHNSFRIKPSKDGSVQLRFEAVDAPEVHYGTEAQPDGDTARDHLLSWMGFKSIQFTGTKVQSATPDSKSGTILSQAAEVNGRPISYVLLDNDAQELDDFVHVGANILEKTLNYRLLESGEAYLTLYSSSPREHRDFFREVARQARAAKRGVWAKDSTPEFQLRNQADINPEGQLILPKLFRRCTDYLKAVDKGFEGTLPDWLTAHSGGSRDENDRVLIEERIGPVPFSTLLQQRNSRISFEADVLEITVEEK
jgi:endonuclease YncB( thermonuclease family)